MGFLVVDLVRLFYWSNLNAFAGLASLTNAVFLMLQQAGFLSIVPVLFRICVPPLCR